MAKRPLAPISPGRILKQEFMEELGLSANALARRLRVPTNRITGIINDTRAISADTALRLARYFGTSEQFWLNLQNRYDLERERDRLGDRLNDIEVWTGLARGA